jgi:RNA 3'-terminal phosphate cyclase (ATP)
MLELDGSMGEGGGQILRTSLALSMVTGTPVRIRGIRARRARPGLMRQHLTAVQAAARVSGARVEGAEVGSREIVFVPEAVRPGEYRFDIGTAGSTTLILQTLLPALLHAGGPSRLTLEGGTHNPQAPPFDYLERVFLPLLRRMGARIEAVLERPGFYPAGGGRFTVTIDPPARLSSLSGLELLERGEIRNRRAIAILSALPRHVAERELRHVVRETGWDPASQELREVVSPGPGNVLLLEVESEALTEVFVGFGERGVPAEEVAARALREMRRYLDAGVPVGEHLADQLLLPLALAGSGAFATLPLSLHATTQIDLIPRFLDVRIGVEERADGGWVVVVNSSR